jgi:amino acid transporter
MKKCLKNTIFFSLVCFVVVVVFVVVVAVVVVDGCSNSLSTGSDKNSKTVDSLNKIESNVVVVVVVVVVDVVVVVVEATLLRSLILLSNSF